MKDDGQGNAGLNYAVQVGSMGNIRIPRFEDSVDLDRLRHTLPATLPLGRAVSLRPPENRAHSSSSRSSSVPLMCSIYYALL